jgi:hypothetical protein
MQLWQMDVMGGLLLEDGTECKIITGIDDPVLRRSGDWAEQLLFADPQRSIEP